MDTENLKTWLTNIITGLVSYPDDIKIEQTMDEMGILFVVKVNESDRGKVIGREGVIANSIRTILRSAGRACDVKASMKIDAGTNFEIKKEAR